MLTELHIRDLVVVERLTLELEAGTTALTGETGAGKSILVDALGLVLGDRADGGQVRAGAARAEIHACFQPRADSDALCWLQEQDLDDEQDCILRRILPAQGRSKAYINGRPVSLQQLRELGRLLVDIHSQHEHQSLLQPDTQRRLLDTHAGNGDLIDQLRSVHRQWCDARERLEQLSGGGDRAAREDLLKFQLQELEALAPQEGEAEQLSAEHRRLAHAEELRDECAQLWTLLHEAEPNVEGQLEHSAHRLREMSDFDADLGAAAELLESAAIQTREAAQSLRDYLEREATDPERLAYVEARLDAWHELARKHKVTPAVLAEVVHRLGAQLQELAHSEATAAALAGEISACEQRYAELASALTLRRRKASKQLERAVTGVLGQLGMQAAQFSVHLAALEVDGVSPHGNERVEFLIATNPGQPPAALRKIASGGELSRCSLALQVVLADDTRIPTLIYDEVDTGIGGAVAEVVGRKLRELGADRQVLCVTHLAQVAAQAHHHQQVSKTLAETGARTHVEALTEEQRVEELARMLGGVKRSDKSRAHAREMLAGARRAPRKRAGG